MNSKQDIKSSKVKLVIDEYSNYPVYFYMPNGIYIEHFNDTFRNMYYLEEEKRGFFPEENLVVPGRYEIEIEENSRKRNKLYMFFRGKY